MDYSPWVQLQTSLINIDEAKAFTMNNQPEKSRDKRKWYWCGSLEHFDITSKEYPIGISYQNFLKGLGDGSLSTRGEEVSKICISRSR